MAGIAEGRASARTAPPSRSTRPTSSLLNLMQGRFPLVERPVRGGRRGGRAARGRGDGSASSACSTSASSARSRRSSTRARSATSRCSSPRRSTPRYPHRAAAGHQRAPRRHAQLPAQPRLQPVVHDRRGARLPARARRARSTSWRRRTRAESIRQLPTLKLFKIRMDLEMEDGTDALAAAGEAAEPMELDPIALSDEDVATIRATQGPMTLRPTPYAPAAERLGVLRGGGAARGWVAAGARRAAARGRDPLPPPRRLLGQRHGRVGGARGRDPRDGQAHGRVPRHLPLLPAPDLPRLAVLRLHHGPRALQGGVRRDPRLDRRARPASSERATLYSSTEFKKVRMLYFTDDFARWEAEHAR